MNLNKPIDQESKQIIFTPFRIIKNLAIIYLTFALLFSAYDGLSMLQSTMNGEQGMGSYSQALVYFSFGVSCLLFPNYFIKKLGCKTNLFVGTVLYLPYIASNVYPTWPTMMFSAVLIGIGASLLWAAQCTYLNEAAGIYCNLLYNCIQDKARHRDGKSEIMNSDVLIIQNGISEKLILEIESRDRFTHLDRVKANATELKYDSTQGNNPVVKTSMVNTKIGCEQNGIIDEKSDCKYKNTELSDTPCNVLNMIEHEKSRSVADYVSNFENLISHNEECNRKESIFYIGNINTSKNIPIVYSTDADNKSRPPSVEYVTNDNARRSSTLESVTARFFGFFGFMYCTAQVWSNLITYYVLNISNETNGTHSANYSCGASFCNSKYETFNSAADKIPLETRYLLIGITSTLSASASLLVLIFLDPLNTDGGAVTFSLGHVMATFHHLKKKQQIFMIPLSVFTGMSQGFFTADFTKSYIECAWSISHVGLVTVSYGLTSGISSSIFGWVVKYTGRIPVVLLGLVLHLGIGGFLLLWNPDSENPLMFYFAAGWIGTVVGLFYSQISAFYGLLFKNDEETAFATHYFCSAMGWMISFIYSDYLCTSIKIYILMSVSCIGILGYLAAERNFKDNLIKK